MKIIISLILSATILLSSGCALVKDNPQVGRTLLSLGLKVAVYKIAQQNPGIVPYLGIVGQSLQEPMDSLNPASLEKRLDVIIRNNVPDPVYASALTDIKNLVVGFYTQVYNKHYDELSQSQFVELIKAFGDGIRFGHFAQSPQAVEFFTYTPTAIIEVR